MVTHTPSGHPAGEALLTAWYGTPGGSRATAAGGLSPEEAGPVLPAGTLLAGRYRLGEPLGAGAFSRVSSAWDLHLHRWVAAKLYASSAAQLSRDEVRLQAGCQHPNLMPLYDAGADPLLGVSFLVMPLYPGGDLASVLRHRGQMPFRSAVLCVDQLCSALEFLWQRRETVHGDVKPGNIWLTHSGAALLLDFNVPGLLVRGGTLRAGTPGYTAPEALEGRADPRSDIFSLGCVLYHCLAGAPPFADDEAVRLGRFTPLRKSRPDVRVSLEDVVRTALHPDPERRFQSARELQTALRRRAAPGLHWGLEWPLVRRDLWWLAGALVRPVWRFAWWYLRFAVRRPLQALCAGGGLAVGAAWGIQAAQAWARTHPAELAGTALLGAGALALRWMRRP